MAQKFCQSCSMPLVLHGVSQYGTNADGSLSDQYCSFCWSSGKFVEPAITFEQMLAKGKAAIAKGKGNSLVKFLMMAAYPSMLKKVSRWKA